MPPEHTNRMMLHNIWYRWESATYAFTTKAFLNIEKTIVLYARRAATSQLTLAFSQNEISFPCLTPYWCLSTPTDHTRCPNLLTLSLLNSRKPTTFEVVRFLKTPR